MNNFIGCDGNGDADIKIKHFWVEKVNKFLIYRGDFL